MSKILTETERIKLLVADKEVVIDATGVYIEGRYIASLAEINVGVGYIADPVMTAAERITGIFGGKIISMRTKRVAIDDNLVL
ncbi:MAG: hypothetical protein QXW98_04885 [Candidatus Caldarchaeum sp.]